MGSCFFNFIISGVSPSGIGEYIYIMKFSLGLCGFTTGFYCLLKYFLLSIRGEIMNYIEEYGLIALRSRQHAIHLNDMLKASGYPVQLMSTPREISVGCGLSIRFPIGLMHEIMLMYERYRYPITGIYHIKRRGNRMEIIRIPY